MATFSGSLQGQTVKNGRTWYLKLEYVGTQNETANTSNINMTLKVYCPYASWNTVSNSSYYLINGAKTFKTYNFATGSWNTLGTRSITVTHNEDGTKSVDLSAAWYSANETTNTPASVTLSGSVTLPIIPRLTTATATGGTLGTTIAIGLTSYQSAYTHTVRYKCGTAGGYISSTSPVSTLAFTFTPPVSLASQNPNGTTVSVDIIVETFNGTQSLGTSTKSIKCTVPDNVKPTVTITVSDANGYNSTYGDYVKGKSKLRITVTATKAEGSSIVSCITTVEGKQYTETSFTSDVISTVGTIDIKSEIIDSRGRKSTASTSVTAVNYVVPVFTWDKLYRCNSEGSFDESGSYVKAIVNIYHWEKTSKSDCGVSYAKTNITSYTNVSSSKFTVETTNSTHKKVTAVFQITADDSYRIRISFQDDFKTHYGVRTLDASHEFMEAHESGHGVAFGKAATQKNKADFGYPIIAGKGFDMVPLPVLANLNEFRQPGIYCAASNQKFLASSLPLEIINNRYDEDGKSSSSGAYADVQIGGANVSLRVEIYPGGLAGQTIQKLITTSKETTYTYERTYYYESWGNWQGDCPRQLWKYSGSDEGYLLTNQYVTLPESYAGKPVRRRLMDQKNGFVLVFQPGNNRIFISKHELKIENPIVKNIILSDLTNDYLGAKFIKIGNDYIVGGDSEYKVTTSDTGTTSVSASPATEVNRRYNTASDPHVLRSALFKLTEVWGV